MHIRSQRLYIGVPTRVFRSVVTSSNSRTAGDAIVAVVDDELRERDRCATGLSVSPSYLKPDAVAPRANL